MGFICSPPTSSGSENVNGSDAYDLSSSQLRIKKSSFFLFFRFRNFYVFLRIRIMALCTIVLILFKDGFFFAFLFEVILDSEACIVPIK